MILHKLFLKTANALISLIIIICLLVVGLYSVYALWDNHRIYQAAENVQADMLEFKPDVERPSFRELYAINKDICAWVSLDNTDIDHPVVQGDTNLTYVNKDIYGNFALAGSIFLDTRCDNSFRDTYSLLYGHHMVESRMFGDLELYKDKAFFDNNKSGVLILPDRAYDLEIFACMLVPASEDMIFEPGMHQGSIDALLDYAEDESVQYSREVAAKAVSDRDPKILSLTTCSEEYTDARTIVLARMTLHKSAE